MTLIISLVRDGDVLASTTLDVPAGFMQADHSSVPYANDDYSLRLRIAD